MKLDKTIELKEIDPIAIYGVNNRNLERLQSYFPKLKVIARGNELRLHGSTADLQRFEESLGALIQLRHRKTYLTPADVDQLFEENDLHSEESNTDPYTIVYGNEGRVITARTPNQKKLVDLYAKNDLLFAIGPAGSGKTYTAIALAVRALKNREIRKIILSRPAV